MDNSSIFAIFATSFGTLLYYSYKRDQKKANLDEIKAAQVFSPEALLNIFKNIDRHPPSRLKPQVSSQNPNEYKVKAFIEGSVACDKPIESHAYKDVKLVHRVSYKEDIYSNSRLVEGTHIQLAPKRDMEVEAPLYFYLKDPFTQDTCKVHRSVLVETNAMEEISVRQITRDLSLFEKGLVYLGLSFEFMRAAMNLTMLTRGIKIGWSEKELGIRIGSTLTVYGEVIYNAVEGKLRIDSPLFYVLEKRNVIEHFKKKLDGLDTIKGMLLVPVIISFYFLMKRLWNHYAKAANVHAMKKADKLWQVTAVKLKDDYKCIKCLKKPRNVIMQPCQDLCLCKGCYDEMVEGGAASKPCPICNEVIKDGVEIYFT